ncbi:hypothetical protein AMECASPLE_012437 [Ameca splendens]|uniref:Uncharacterized protein n=1 Tax=Ameca splendens TaxID=208324 RepID=A0ABV0YN75_9TELE
MGYIQILLMQVEPQMVKELSDALFRIWEKILGEDASSHKEHAPPSSGMHTSTWGPYKQLNNILSCCDDISANWTSLPQFFCLNFSVTLDQVLCGLITFVFTK